MKTSNFYRRYEIMLKCWQNEPDVRPTFSELKNLLKEMENQHKVGQIEGPTGKIPFIPLNFLLLKNSCPTRKTNMTSNLQLCRFLVCPRFSTSGRGLPKTKVKCSYRVGSAIHRIGHYPVSNSDTYLLDIALFIG